VRSYLLGEISPLVKYRPFFYLGRFYLSLNKNKQKKFKMGSN
jgi:hypothetical protein